MVKHLPNMLSALRLGAAPLVAWEILQGHDAAALLVFALASFSDLLDGFIARRWGVVSRFGTWLDPVADKLLILLCFLALLKMGAAPFWLVALVIARDALIVGGVLLARALYLPVGEEPLLLGKSSTFVQVGYVGAWLVLLSLGMKSPWLMDAFAAAVAILAVLSGLAYGQLFLRALFFVRRTA